MYWILLPTVAQVQAGRYAEMMLCGDDGAGDKWFADFFSATISNTRTNTHTRARSHGSTHHPNNNTLAGHGDNLHAAILFSRVSIKAPHALFLPLLFLSLSPSRSLFITPSFLIKTHTLLPPFPFSAIAAPIGLLFPFF